MTTRHLILGLATVTGWRKWGFFIPCRHAAAAAPREGRGAYPAIEALFAARSGAFIEQIGTLSRYAPLFAQFKAARPPAPRWEQDWFPGLDGAAAYALVRTRRPRLLIEIGCGHSSRFFARAAADEGWTMRQIAIDPRPRAVLDGLGIELVRSTVQAVGEAPFADIGAGDIVSLDGSHILMPGTDVDLFFSKIMPALPPGALVHIHDIFLPDDYPEAWGWRSYNEQQGVAALLPGSVWRVLWASHYVRTRLSEAIAASPLAGLPLPPGAHESSLWLEKMEK